VANRSGYWMRSSLKGCEICEEQRRKNQGLYRQIERTRGLFDDALIERGLFRRQVAEDLHLHFFRQILYHGAVCLEPPQDERRSQFPQLQRGLGIGPLLNGGRNPMATSQSNCINSLSENMPAPLRRSKAFSKKKAFGGKLTQPP